MNKYYNKEKTAIYDKRYRSENKEQISEQKKKCYKLHQHNKIKNEKLITCECGKILNFGSLIKHRKSPFHFKMLESCELYFN